MKTCTTCGEEKPLSEFHKKKSTKSGYHGSCKVCKQTYEKEKYADPEVRARMRERQADRSLERLYGITREKYNELLAAQKHSCAICERHESEFKTRLAVDHNHISGEIRGLLCNFCNRRLVGRHRDGNLLRKIADYVDQGTGLFVPKKKKTIKRRPKRG